MCSALLSLIKFFWHKVTCRTSFVFLGWIPVLGVVQEQVSGYTNKFFFIARVLNVAIFYQISNFQLSIWGVLGWEHLPHWKNKVCSQRRKSQCKEILRWNPVIWKSHISTVRDQTLSSKITTLVSTEQVYQSQPPEFGSGEDQMVCQQSCPQHHWINLGSALACSWCQSDQRTSNKCWLKNGMLPHQCVTMLVIRMEEEQPGWCSFFHTAETPVC